MPATHPAQDLNQQQIQAVTAGTGQVLVLAGPGSGKTRVLTQRIVHVITEMHVKPYNILAVTFTNKAAREMRNRLEHLLGEDTVRDLWLGTFHAICARILRREAQYLPFTPSYVIMDADDQESLVKRALKDLNLDDKLFRPSGLLTAISAAKNDMLAPDKVPTRSYREEVVARVYARYQQILLNSNAVDFDDLLLYAVRLLEENPQVKERYARRFEHVLVDEFQDTNHVQYELLRHLSSYHQNLFVVGDEDQSIYRWRGADYRNVLRFEQDYPKCQKILLEQNYRSTQNVLDAARAVIDRNPYRTPKHLFSERGSGERIVLYEAADDRGEAVYVVDCLQQWLGSGRARGGDFAIMYRTNAQSRLLEEAFLHAGLPYRLVGAQRFYGRREVKDIIAYLRLVQNPNDEVSLNRVINTPPRGIGEKTVQTLQTAATQAQLGPGGALLDLALQGQKSPLWSEFQPRAATALAHFGALLDSWMQSARQVALPELFDRILLDIDFHTYISDGTEEGESRWENVQELRKLAYEYADRGLVEFLENLALVSDQDTLPEKLEAPTLLTLHAAKGLEFPQVFITGLDEGLLPHSRSRDDPEEMAEERRLFYVGLTRAKNRLYLVRSWQRSSYGEPTVSEPSRFLRDIPTHLLEHQGLRNGGRSRQAARWEGSQRWEGGGTHLAPEPPPQGTPPRQVEAHFQPAMHVRHSTWGDGIVLDSRVRDGTEMVDVFFESVGFKRLDASIARLETIENHA